MVRTNEGSAGATAWELSTADGATLHGSTFPAEGSRRGRVVLAAATGVPQGFYGRFARHAASRGLEVRTFDYRGIGRSKTGSLAALDASFLDWARLDLAAVIDAVPDDGEPLYLVGHSFGAHALGLLPNHDRLRAVSVCGAGAGWAGWMEPGERRKLWWLWNVVFPPLVRVLGYMPMSWFGAGEDLPAGVYRQWRRWCTFPHYFLEDPTVPELAEACATVRTPILALTATDDAWAPPSSRDAFVLHAYTGASVRCVDVDPADHGGSVGHMGYFRPRAAELWDVLLDGLLEP